MKIFNLLIITFLISCSHSPNRHIAADDDRYTRWSYPSKGLKGGIIENWRDFTKTSIELIEEYFDSPVRAYNTSLNDPCRSVMTEVSAEKKRQMIILSYRLIFIENSPEKYKNIEEFNSKRLQGACEYKYIDR